MKSEDNGFLTEKQWKKLDSMLKSTHCSADKGLYSQGCGLPSGHVQLWELDRKVGRMSKNLCLWTVVLEKTPESPFREQGNPTNLKGDQPWMFTGRTDAKAEAPEFWSSDENRWLVSKVPDAGKDWGQKEKRVLEDEMAGQRHWCNEYELGQTLGDGEGEGGLACCSPKGHKESDTTWQLHNSNNNITYVPGIESLHGFNTWHNLVLTLTKLFISISVYFSIKPSDPHICTGAQMETWDKF